MEKGKCCEYCVKHEKPECPVKNAEPWSRWKNFCSEFEENEKAAIVRSNATAGWINVGDGLPDRSIESVLVYKNGSIMMAYVEWYFYQNDCRNTDITHWMPLPEPPGV